MISRPYQMCVRCVMDTTDLSIEFDEQGVCNHCRSYENFVSTLLPETDRKTQLDDLVKQIKIDGTGKFYDCVIGVSGGVDSTYVAYLVHSLGLRPLAVHMDNGWDSELAIGNVKNMLDKLGIDLCTIVLDWEEFKDVQLSFLRASTSDAEIPTDHAIWAVLRRVAIQHKISYIITGNNWVTEFILPQTWTYGVRD